MSENYLIGVRGLLLFSRGEITQGTARILEAIEWSRSHATKLFELRAVRDLARLQIPEGRSGHTIKELRDVIAWFPDSLETPDLREARELL